MHHGGNLTITPPAFHDILVKPCGMLFDNMTDKKETLTERIRALGDENDYHGQAELFVIKTATTINIVEAVPQKAPLWAKESEKHGIHYSITLKNKNGAYTFDYWGSIADREKVDLAHRAQKDGVNSPTYFAFMDWAKKTASPTVPNMLTASRGPLAYTWLKNAVDTAKCIVMPKWYDVLTCLHPMGEDNFTDWCSSYGYDTDSITAEKTYLACVDQDNHMRRLFTHEEIEALAEIV
jgi:hypothetical protein